MNPLGFTDGGDGHALRGVTGNRTEVTGMCYAG